VLFAHFVYPARSSPCYGPSLSIALIKIRKRVASVERAGALAFLFLNNNSMRPIAHPIWLGIGFLISTAGIEMHCYSPRAGLFIELWRDLPTLLLFSA